jgi:protein-S-isoprenylcysteine O-methyltransferase Ste14
MTVHDSPRYFFPKPYADFVQRCRVAFGFVLLVAFAWFSQPSISSLLIGVPLSLAGLLIRGWAAGHLAKDQQLATTGPYAFMRNPLYAGTLVAVCGIVIGCRSVVLAAIFLLAFVLVYLPVIELEEQHLRELFPEYDAYAARVYRFLPFRKWRDSRGSFSPALYTRNQEYKAALGFLVALAWMAWKCWLSRTVR